MPAAPNQSLHSTSCACVLAVPNLSLRSTSCTCVSSVRSAFGGRHLHTLTVCGCKGRDKCEGVSRGWLCTSLLSFSCLPRQGHTGSHREPVWMGWLPVGQLWQPGLETHVA